MESGGDTVVINLAERTDRRTEMQSELRRVHWRARFFPAIRPQEKGDFPSIGSRGCFLSHLQVLKHARDNLLSRLIILEDDLTFASDFVKRWQTVMAVLEDRDWSIFYPGHALKDTLPGIREVDSSTPIQCAHFMVINGTVLPRLVEGLERILSRQQGHPLGGPMHVDGAYSTIRAQNANLRTYVISPVLGYQRSSRTDIGELNLVDRLSILRPAVNRVRKFKNALRHK
jgi:glycosyl transferase, family 25